MLEDALNVRIHTQLQCNLITLVIVLKYAVKENDTVIFNVMIQLLQL